MADEFIARSKEDKLLRGFTEGKRLLTRPRRRQYGFQRTYVIQKRDQHLTIEHSNKPEGQKRATEGTTVTS